MFTLAGGWSCVSYAGTQHGVSVITYWLVIL